MTYVSDVAGRGLGDAHLTNSMRAPNNTTMKQAMKIYRVQYSAKNRRFLYSRKIVAFSINNLKLLLFYLHVCILNSICVKRR